MKPFASGIAIGASVASGLPASGQFMPQYVLSRLVPEGQPNPLSPTCWLDAGQFQDRWVVAADGDLSTPDGVRTIFGDPELVWFTPADARVPGASPYTDLSNGEEVRVVPLPSPAWLGAAGVLALASRRRRC